MNLEKSKKKILRNFFLLNIRFENIFKEKNTNFFFRSQTKISNKKKFLKFPDYKSSLISINEPRKIAILLRSLYEIDRHR